MSPEPDHEAAAVHRARAERHYLDAEQFRQLGQKVAYRAALQMAWGEDDLAEALATGQPVEGRELEGGRP